MESDLKPGTLNLETHFQPSVRTSVDSKTDLRTCGIHNTIGKDGSVRSLDIPLAIGSRAEPGDGGRVVDLGTVHSGASSERHSEGVRVDVAVSWCVQTCQHLIDLKEKTSLWWL